MSVGDWIYRIVAEGIKYVILAHWFFGYEFKWKKSSCLLVVYLISIPMVDAWASYTGAIELDYGYSHLWRIVLLLALFEGGVLEKIKAFFLIWFLIAFVDVIFTTPFLLFVDSRGQEWLIMFAGCIGTIFWIFLGWKAKKLQKAVQSFWEILSFGEYIVILLLLLITSYILGGIQGYLYELITSIEKEIVFTLALMAVTVFIFIYASFFYTRQSKKRLEKINQLNISYMELQKKYYEDSLRQYEDMRSFRHDINRHIYMLLELSREDKRDELKDYISDMAESYKKIRVIHTGNFVADCIISHTLSELQTDGEFQFQIDGRFPEQFPMEDIDFCILLSNVLDNAKEALEKVEGKRLLHIEIRRYLCYLYIYVRNSVAEKNIDFEHTSKSDGNHHGYGTQNIRRVVEQYGGTIEWRLDEGVVVVAIKIAEPDEGDE